MNRQQDFAKIFNSDFGQILVLIDNNDDDLPEIKIVFKHEGLKFDIKINGFTDDDGVWDRAQDRFDRLEKKLVCDMVRKALTQLYEQID